ncbi:dihydrodipicolinate synthase family protein [Megalodesulfovibrio paquesii]
MFVLEGIYPAMLTPFTEEGRINEPVLRDIVEFQITNGLDGLFPVSSCGEAIHLSFAEKCQLMEIVVDQARGRVPVTPGVPATTADESIRLARHAKAVGCAAVVASAPYYYKASMPMLERFFERVATEGGMPVILYNIPLFSQPLPYDVVARLSRLPNVVGMKDSSGSIVDFLHFKNSAEEAGGEVSMLTGREEGLLACLHMGGRGCMTATSGILPEIMTGIYAAFKAGEYAKAKALQESILAPIRSMMFGMPFPIGFKLGMEVRGFPMGAPRVDIGKEEAGKLTACKERLTQVLRPLVNT